MTSLVTVSILLLITPYSLPIENFNPSTINYCNIKCDGTNNLHTACECYKSDSVEELLDDVGEFRQMILDKHNYYRSFVASGEAASKNPAITSAADMNILSYDLELEYIARCLARKFREMGSSHDSCRNNRYNKYLGQNLFGISIKGDQLRHSVETSTDSWFQEITLPTVTNDLVERYSNGKHGHFTQMIWADTKYIGCAKAWDPEQPVAAWRLVVVCNYGGDGGNVLGDRVYTKGEPCANCSAGLSCQNKQYPALCGKGKASILSISNVSLMHFIFLLLFIH